MTPLYAWHTIRKVLLQLRHEIITYFRKKCDPRRSSWACLCTVAKCPSVAHQIVANYPPKIPTLQNVFYVYKKVCIVHVLYNMWLHVHVIGNVPTYLSCLCILSDISHFKMLSVKFDIFNFLPI